MNNVQECGEEKYANMTKEYAEHMYKTQPKLGKPPLSKEELEKGFFSVNLALSYI